MNQINKTCYGEKISSKNGYDIIDCVECGFIHIHPFPSLEEVDKIYSDQYYTQEKPDYINSYKKDLDWWNVIYDERFDFFENFVKDDKTIFDVGSGTGYFLKRGVERGWEALGIEPNEAAYKYSTEELGMKVIHNFLDVSSKEGIGSFKVIHMSEVLEHISNPIELINIVFEKLKKNGILCISVPNDYNRIQKILAENFKFDSWWEAPPHHVNYFTIESLSNLLCVNGFEILNTTVSFPIDLFLLMGKNYVGNDSIGKECHEMRMQFEKNLFMSAQNDFKKSLYEKFAELGIGREIIIYAQKK